MDRIDLSGNRERNLATIKCKPELNLENSLPHTTLVSLIVESEVGEGWGQGGRGVTGLPNITRAYTTFDALHLCQVIFIVELQRSDIVAGCMRKIAVGKSDTNMLELMVLTVAIITLCTLKSQDVDIWIVHTSLSHLTHKLWTKKSASIH